MCCWGLYDLYVQIQISWEKSGDPSGKRGDIVESTILAPCLGHLYL